MTVHTKVGSIETSRVGTVPNFLRQNREVNWKPSAIAQSIKAEITWINSISSMLYSPKVYTGISKMEKQEMEVKPMKHMNAMFCAVTEVMKF